MSDTKFFIDDAERIIPPVNDTPYKRIIAVGDVHGKLGKLMSLWKNISVTDNDLLIFLGDYIDRGECVAEVLERIIPLRGRKNVVLLRGNHEQMLIHAFSGDEREFTEKIFGGSFDASNHEDLMRHGETLAWLAYNGGNRTMLALHELQRTKKFTVDEVLYFARHLPLSYTLEIGGRKYFFCHAGVDPTLPLDNQPEEALLWIREKFFNSYGGDAVIVSGHTPLQLVFDFGDEPLRPMIFLDKNILMVDTGSFITGGKISAVDILSGQYWQSDDEIAGDIIFVCAWNTCRSAMAEYIMRHLINRAGLDEKISVNSAGCLTEGGEPLGYRTSLTLENNGIHVGKHISKSFTAEMYKNFKCVIALDDDILHMLKREFGDPENKIRLLKDSAGNPISVDDPGIDGRHADAYEKIYRGCETLLKEFAD